MRIELELNELRRRAGLAPITEEDLRIVERCSRAVGIKLNEVWRLLRQGVSPYSVFAELGIVDRRPGS